MEYTLENYNAGLAEIEKEMQARKDKLIREYAIANNPYKEGDIVTDADGSLIIKTIKIMRPYHNELPSCIYYGVELKKDGTPKVRQTQRRVSQFNIIKEDGTKN